MKAWSNSSENVIMTFQLDDMQLLAYFSTRLDMWTADK
jgi:hypothetical protein